jgi:pentatricopeptide repeat protein
LYFLFNDLVCFFSDQVHGLGHAPLHPSGFPPSSDRIPPLHNVPIQGIFERNTVVEGAVPENAGHDQHVKTVSKVGGSAGAVKAGPPPTPKVGFAAVPSLTTVENVVTGGRSNSYRVPRQQSNSSSSRNSSAVAVGKEIGVDSSASSDKESSSSSTKGIPVPSSGGAAQQRYGNDGARQYDSGNFKSGWQSRGAQSKPSAFPASSPVRPWAQHNGPLAKAPSSSLPRHLSVGAAVGIPRDELPVPRSSSKERFNAAPGRGGQNGRNPSGSRRQSQKAVNSESRAANGEVVDHVCNILRQLNWRPDTLVALSHVNRTLSAFHINEVLKHQKESGLALKFFDWAKGQEGYKHDVCTYTTMIGLLGRARNFEACTRLLQEMRGEGCEPCVVTYNRLIHAYGRANYLGEAMRIFYQMQESGCSPDRVTYCTLVDLHSKAGFHDTAMDMYRQMQQAGFQPDTFTYRYCLCSHWH